MSNAYFAILGVLLGAALTFFLTRLGGRLDRNREKRLAAAGLLYEMEMNLEWSKGLTLDGLGPYLRDEVHVYMKNRGGIGDLPDSVRRQLICAYEALYRLNESTRRLREGQDPLDNEGYGHLIEDFQTKAKDLPKTLEDFT
ncbi:MAG: hypothetical protein WCF63_09665 [Acidimicrobiales bacterium]